LRNHAEDIGARIEVMNEREEKTPHEEPAEDLLALVTGLASVQWRRS